MAITPESLSLSHLGEKMKYGRTFGCTNVIFDVSAERMKEKDARAAM
jgi:hypothetical protein